MYIYADICESTRIESHGEAKGTNMLFLDRNLLVPTHSSVDGNGVGGGVCPHGISGP